MMKLGTETGSLVNHLYSQAPRNEPAPFVGQGATILSWSDRQAATVVAVRELAGARWAFEIEVTDDTTRVVSGSMHDGSAVFETTPNPDGPRTLYRKARSTGEWVKGYRNPSTDRFNTTGTRGGLVLGRRDHYYDPSF